MKKFIKILCCSLFAISSALMLSACSTEQSKTVVLEKLDPSMITLDYNSANYTGQAHTPSVIVTGENGEVSQDEYFVTYENNINAGTAKVIVCAKEGSQYVKGVTETNFIINRVSTEVSAIDELTYALDSNNYNDISISSNITVAEGSTLSVDENETLNFGDNFLTNNGKVVNNGIINISNYNGNGELENNNKIKTAVANKTKLMEAFEFANDISLTNDITSTALKPIDTRIENGNIEWKYKDEETWKILISTNIFLHEDEIERNILLQTTNSHLQWKLEAIDEGDYVLNLFDWNNLIERTALDKVGENGNESYTAAINAGFHGNKLKWLSRLDGEDVDEIDLKADNRNYEFTLDLAGHSIEVPITLRNSYAVSGESYVGTCWNYGINATITNTGVDAYIGSPAYKYSYGIFLSGNHLMSLNIVGTNKNIQVYGHTYALVTNGCHYNFNANLSASDCAFTAPHTFNAGMGAYLPAAYNYNFEKCLFEGATGYYTKNGNHEISNCQIRGTAYFNENKPQGEGGAPTGAAVVVDWGAWTSFPFNMIIKNNSLLHSDQNYAIQEFPNWNNDGEDSLGLRDITRQVKIDIYDSMLESIHGNYYSANNFIKVHN